MVSLLEDPTAHESAGSGYSCSLSTVSLLLILLKNSGCDKYSMYAIHPPPAPRTACGSLCLVPGDLSLRWKCHRGCSAALRESGALPANAPRELELHGWFWSWLPQKRYDMRSNDMISNDMVLYWMIWHDMIWYDMIFGKKQRWS